MIQPAKRKDANMKVEGSVKLGDHTFKQLPGVKGGGMPALKIDPKRPINFKAKLETKKDPKTLGIGRRFFG